MGSNQESETHQPLPAGGQPPCWGKLWQTVLQPLPPMVTLWSQYLLPCSLPQGGHVLPSIFHLQICKHLAWQRLTQCPVGGSDRFIQAQIMTLPRWATYEAVVMWATGSLALPKEGTAFFPTLSLRHQAPQTTHPVLGSKCRHSVSGSLSCQLSDLGQLTSGLNVPSIKQRS